MREGKIIGKFKIIDQTLQQLMTSQQILNRNAGQMIHQLRNDIISISLYVETLNDYAKKWWTGWGLLPIGVYPGKKIFNTIYDKKVNDMNKIREEHLRKQQEEAKNNENKKVHN